MKNFCAKGECEKRDLLAEVDRLKADAAAAYQRGHDIGRQIGWAEHQSYLKKTLEPEIAALVSQ